MRTYTIAAEWVYLISGVACGFGVIISADIIYKPDFIICICNAPDHGIYFLHLYN